MGEGTATSNDAVGMLVGDGDGDDVADDSAHGRYGGVVCGFGV